ncbi:MAG: hypothetical protein ABSG53_22740, partial [Thermoguttaceae bacterium]
PDEGIIPKTLETGKSTENNADIFAAFTALASIETSLGNLAEANDWTARADIAGDFVMAMLDPTGSHFYAGTVPVNNNLGGQPGYDPTGPQKGNDIINKYDFLDSDSFTTLAMASAPRYSQMNWRLPVQYIVDHFSQTITAGGQTYEGFDIVAQPTAVPGDNRTTPGPNGIAWEFTGQAVEVMRYVDALYGDNRFESLADSYLAQIAQAQASAPFGDGRGLVAATVQDGDTLAPLNQGLTTPFQFIPERVGLPATDWAIFADQKYNPEAGLAVNAVWAATGGGTFHWSAPSNWQGGVVPGVAGDAALFGTAVGSGVATVLLDADRHLSSLTFSPATGSGYVLSGSGGYSLYLANGGPASVSVNGGSSSIDAPVVLGSDLNVAAAPGTSLTISGAINESGGSHALTFSGGGTLTLSGIEFTRRIVVSSGTLVAASIGSLPGGSSLVIGEGGTFIFDPTASASNVTAALATMPAINSAGVVLATAEVSGHDLLVSAAAISAPDTPTHDLVAGPRPAFIATTRTALASTSVQAMGDRPSRLASTVALHSLADLARQPRATESAHAASIRQLNRPAVDAVIARHYEADVAWLDDYWRALSSDNQNDKNSSVLQALELVLAEYC